MLMTTSAIQPVTHYLRDYQPSDFLVDKIDLTFDIQDKKTVVTSRMLMNRNPAVSSRSQLTLDGDAALVTLALDGEQLTADQYQQQGEKLVIFSVPDSFVLEVITEIDPSANTALMGLYASNGNLFTQCEPEGFRHITYYLDRPDVMSRFSTTIIADRQRYPVLLSNGNKVGEGALEKKRHWAKWVDPYRKPSYLFALVAGQLVVLEDKFVTRSGRKVVLQIWTEASDQPKAHHAMASLKHAMRWDEERFNLEYDLDIFMIVAVSDFNMGAMENKGLNIFNTKYVLAQPTTATDADFEGIESVIGHEYFHNWTGNRVTCRDWFQLSLKEGLTVFRDQEFSGDMGSASVKRIDDVKVLRRFQFPEDAGPTAHPVRPASYIEINNFYTLTIYEKGAEVVRMYQTLLGQDGFARGMALYFKRHDGQAVTCDDFRAAMADANQVDLTQFGRWYEEVGTPVLTVKGQYDASARTYTLDMSQHLNRQNRQDDTLPLLIPVKLGLIGSDGQDMMLQLKGSDPVRDGSLVVSLTEKQQQFTFINVPEEPVPSLLRGFSAPVELRYDWADNQLAFLMAHDSDSFCRWEAGQTLARRMLVNLYHALSAKQPLTLPSGFLEAYRSVLTDDSIDPAFKALMLTLPSEHEMLEWLDEVDPALICQVLKFVNGAIAQQFRGEWRDLYYGHQTAQYQLADAGARSLKNRALFMLNYLHDDWSLETAARQFEKADNMTDQIWSLIALNDQISSVREQCFDQFSDRWRRDPLVMDKYFALIADSRLPNVLDQVQQAMNHPAFNPKNPNKIRSLIGTFGRNMMAFHAADGSGYQFMAEMVLQVDAFNAQVASRLAQSFSRWRKTDAAHQQLARQALESILNHPKLSKDVYEIVSKSLNN